MCVRYTRAHAHKRTAGPHMISARHLEARQNGSEGLSKEKIRAAVLVTVVTVVNIRSPVFRSSSAFYLLRLRLGKKCLSQDILIENKMQ